jgi:hypothetical protein
MHRCKFSMKNGRENRTNGNEEKGKKEEKALSKSSAKANRGTQNASPKFLGGQDGKLSGSAVYFICKPWHLFFLGRAEAAVGTKRAVKINFGLEDFRGDALRGSLNAFASFL